MNKKIITILIFILFIFIGRTLILNPTGKMAMMIIGIGFFIFYAYLSYKKPFTALIIFLIFLPFYSWFRFNVFHNSTIGLISKDALLGILFFLWALKKLKNQERVNIPSWWKVMIFYLLIATINIFKAPSVMGGLLDWRIMVFYPLSSLLFFDLIDTRKKFLKLIRILVFVGIIVALYGIYQRIFFYKYGSVMAEELFGVGTMRNEAIISSTVGHHGVLGIYITMMLSFLYIIHLEKIKFLTNWLKIASIGLFTLVIAFTSNRTAWVGFMVLIIFIFFTIKKNKILPFLIMIGIFIGIVVGNQFFRERFSDITNPLGSGSSFRIRYLSWQGRLRIGLGNPMGIGLGQVGMSAKSTYGISDISTRYRGFTRVIDNLYLVIFMEMGYPGFLFFLIFWIALFLWVLKSYRNNKNPITFIGLILVIIFSLADFTGAYLNFILLQMYFWVGLTGVFAIENEK